jgi:hypothetical protein
MASDHEDTQDFYQAVNVPRQWTVYWAPEGRAIAKVTARTEHEAIRKAPLPYRRKLGELYAL